MAIRKLGIEEWIVQFVQAVHNNTRRKVRVSNTYNDEFGVKVGFHQDSVLTRLLFIIELEALSREFCTGTPWELLYADDLVINAETEDELRMKLIKWKTNLETKGLRVNTKKPRSWLAGSTSKRWRTLVNTHAVFVEKLLVVTPSTVLACIGFIINVVPLLAG